jgi:hypothetical protein
MFAKTYDGGISESSEHEAHGNTFSLPTLVYCFRLMFLL